MFSIVKVLILQPLKSTVKGRELLIPIMKTNFSKDKHSTHNDRVYDFFMLVYDFSLCVKK